MRQPPESDPSRNLALVAGGNVGGAIVNSDSTTVVCWAEEDTDNVWELYSVPIGGGVSVKLNGAFVAGGNVSEFIFADDGTIVLYRADQDVDSQTEL